MIPARIIEWFIRVTLNRARGVYPVCFVVNLAQQCVTCIVFRTRSSQGNNKGCL
jgi:hypothetical protein